MEKQIQLSIIIPVYNVEKYIEFTLKSISSQKQDLLNYEVIVVDDGSPDNSIGIVESYRKELPQIKIYRQENQGLSGARNSGLKVAKGQYVWFVDSDDTITNNAFQIIYKIISKSSPDIIGFSINHICAETGTKCIEPCIFRKSYKKLYYKELAGISLHTKIHSGVVQRYIFNRSFLIENNLQFFPGIYFEDDEFLVRAKCLAGKVMLTDKIIYNYLTGRSGSIMSSFRLKHLQDVLIIIENFVKFKESNIHNSEIVNIVNGAIFNESFWLLCQSEKTVNGYSSFMSVHKKEIKRMTIKFGLMSLFPITLGKIKKRLLLIKYLFFA